MVEKYNQLRALNKISPDEATCLQDEKNAALNVQSRLRDRLQEALERGTGLFQGKAWDGSALGKSLGEALKALCGRAVPVLYPKLEMGSRPLKGDEAELVLKTVDLKALPQVFYAGEGGLGLVVKEGPKLVPNPAADVARKVLDYLASESDYGNNETRMGKTLERRFGGSPYGWEPDMLRLILALLFRAGQVEVTYQGNRFHSYQDPQARVPFTKVPAFRSSLFSPRQTVGLKTLTRAVEQLEDLTGEEVDVEEGAITGAFKKVASEELERLHPLKAVAEAHALPIRDLLTDFQQTLQGIQSSASDDCVRILTETGPIFQEIRKRVRHLREALDDAALERLKQARAAVSQVWPRLAHHVADAGLEESVGELKAILASEEVIDRLGDAARHTKAIADAYCLAYLDLFDRRAEAYRRAIEDIKNRPEWAKLPEDAAAEAILAPLTARLGSVEDRNAVSGGEALGRSTLSEMESDLAAVEGLKSAAVKLVQDRSHQETTERPIRRGRVSGLYDRPIESQDDLEEVSQKLHDSLQKLIDEGAAIILE